MLYMNDITFKSNTLNLLETNNLDKHMGFLMQSHVPTTSHVKVVQIR